MGGGTIRGCVVATAPGGRPARDGGAGGRQGQAAVSAHRIVEEVRVAQVKLADRVAALEAEVARLKAKPEGDNQPRRDWLDVIWGSFANDPVYEQAMRLGRQY